MLQEKNPLSGFRFEREKTASTEKTNAKKFCASYFYQSVTYMPCIILEAMSTHSHD